MGIIFGTSCGKFSARISVDLKRDFHVAYVLQRTHQVARNGIYP